MHFAKLVEILKLVKKLHRVEYVLTYPGTRVLYVALFLMPKSYDKRRRLACVC